MSDIDSKMDSTGGADVQALRNEVQSLQGLLSFSVMLMFVVSLAVNVFLWKQTSDRTQDLRNSQMVLNNFVNGGEMQARDFWFKLSAYATTHPDFAPVYNKWSQIITIRPDSPRSGPVTIPAPKK